MMFCASSRSLEGRLASSAPSFALRLNSDSADASLATILAGELDESAALAAASSGEPGLRKRSSNLERSMRVCSSAFRPAWVGEREGWEGRKERGEAVGERHGEGQAAATAATGASRAQAQSKSIDGVSETTDASIRTQLSVRSNHADRVYRSCCADPTAFPHRAS